jgi:hypothetical protein
MADNSGRVGRRTISNGRHKKHGYPHPYKEFEGTPIWNRVNQAVAALLKNGDIQLTTRREYVVGYICRKVGS